MTKENCEKLYGVQQYKGEEKVNLLPNILEYRKEFVEQLMSGQGVEVVMIFTPTQRFYFFPTKEDAEIFLDEISYPTPDNKSLLSWEE